MPASPLGWLLLLAGGIVAFLAAEMVYLSVALAWGDRNTDELGYYGAPPAERERFRRVLRRQARILAPILRLLGRPSSFDFAKTSFRYRGLAAPKGNCSPESFARAEAWKSGPSDVFVATQMKCGTTWMLHVVYEVLLRGDGNLVESGSTLHAVCPWIEGRKTVSMEDAPLISSQRPSRIIKTHLPGTHVPWSVEARYIYVARHPVSCFASCGDFIRENAGRFAPPSSVIEAWFRSEELMWWGTWPIHVESWWRRSEAHPNVLFVTFEDMKRDLAAVVRRVVEFLGVRPLSETELGQVLHKCSFRYMQEHQGAFEMHPPHILAVDAELFVRGSTDRHADVPEAERRRITEWCAARLEGGRFPLRRFYPDVATGGR
jgi:hypothetical protein